MSNVYVIYIFFVINYQFAILLTRTKTGIPVFDLGITLRYVF